jgi:dTDP-4-dehydrorhamnose 3,5-epimerase-like enzyme
MDAKIIDLPDFVTADGHLAVVDPSRNPAIPFRPVRMFWAGGVPQGCHRGGHAHYKCQQIVIAVAGRFDVEIVDTNGARKTFALDTMTQALWIPPMHWDTLKNFSHDAVCLVLASTPYDPKDYVEDFRAFLAMEKKA